MASEVSICNLALQKLGAARINSLTEDSVNARECNLVYETIRDRELRKHQWSFAKTRVALAPDASAPAGWPTGTYGFTLPSDSIRIIKVLSAADDTDELDDYDIAGRKIITSDTTVLYLVYIKRVTDPNQFDTLFIDALASALADQMCEKITQSVSKKADAQAAYKTAIAEAKRINAVEKPPEKAPVDDWVGVRQ